jgi:putative tricarboxylic transport membrane protein
VTLRNPDSMRRPHQIAGLVLLLLGLFVISEAVGLRYYTRLGPGPGFFPLWLGGLLSALAVVMILRATFAPPEPVTPGFFTDRRGYLSIGAIVLCLVVAAAFLKSLGFSLTLSLILLFLLRVLGRTAWLPAIAAALLGGFGVYHVFVHWLGVPLPAGLLAF